MLLKVLLIHSTLFIPISIITEKNNISTSVRSVNRRIEVPESSLF